MLLSHVIMKSKCNMFCVRSIIFNYQSRLPSPYLHGWLNSEECSSLDAGNCGCLSETSGGSPLSDASGREHGEESWLENTITQFPLGYYTGILHNRRVMHIGHKLSSSIVYQPHERLEKCQKNYSVLVWEKTTNQRRTYFQEYVLLQIRTGAYECNLQVK